MITKEDLAFTDKKKPRKRASTPGTRKPRVPKAPPVLTLPEPIPEIKQWVIVGLDPSVTRTGYAISLVTRNDDGSTSQIWSAVGSLAPEDAEGTKAPVWIRCRAMAMQLLSAIENSLVAISMSGSIPDWGKATGLILSAEQPTPRNDYLTSVNRIIWLTLLDPTAGLINHFQRIHIQTTNASTLRSLMGLKKTGSKNKTENVTKAYTFLDGTFSNLDTDSCDAVLMSMMARHTASLLMGNPSEVPANFLHKLCNGATETVGKGRNSRTRTIGNLHRPEYWTRYEKQFHSVVIRNSRVKSTRLTRSAVFI